MKAIHRTRVAVLASSLVLVAGIGAAVQPGRSLMINGQVASTDLRVINGHTYVPLADIARALNMTLVDKPGSIEMTPGGGANQVSGMRGKLGDVIFTGKWRFTLNSLTQVDTYTTKYEGDQVTITPRNPGEVLFVANCRLKNAQKEPMEMVLTTHSASNTALADDKEHSYAPVIYDAHDETGPYGGPKMLPGSASEFAVVFSAPQGTVPKDFIFSIISGLDLANAKQGVTPGIDLRISTGQ